MVAQQVAALNERLTNEGLFKVVNGYQSGPQHAALTHLPIQVNQIKSNKNNLDCNVLKGDILIGTERHSISNSPKPLPHTLLPCERVWRALETA